MMTPSLGEITYVTTSEITADKCKVIEWYLQFPLMIEVESLVTGNRYQVYPDWHCYEDEETAIKATQKYKDGYEDIIY